MKISTKRPTGQNSVLILVISLISLFFFMCSCANQGSSNDSKELKQEKAHDRIVFKGQDTIDIGKVRTQAQKKVDEAMSKPQEDNGWFNYEEASLNLNLEGCENIILLADEKVSEKNIDLITKIVKQNEKALSMVDKGYNKPDFQIPMHYDLGAEDRVPDFLKLRSLANLLVVAGNYERNRGDYSQAAMRYLQTLYLGQGIAKNGTLIFGMIGIVCERKALPALNELLKEKTITKQTCSFILQEVSRIYSNRIAFRELLDCELLMVENTLDLLRDGKMEAIQDMKMYQDATVREKSRERYEKWYKYCVNALMYDYAGTIETLEKQVITNDETPENFFIPNISKAYKQFVFTSARYQGVMTLAALKIYEKDNNGYPASLEKLTPTYLETSPRDPFTNKEMTYTLKGNGFVLYSVGNDLRDDGSVPATDNINQSGDIVFNSNAD
jgi:hypothetical protein